MHSQQFVNAINDLFINMRPWIETVFPREVMESGLPRDEWKWPGSKGPNDDATFTLDALKVSRFEVVSPGLCNVPVGDRIGFPVIFSLLEVSGRFHWEAHWPGGGIGQWQTPPHTTSEKGAFTQTINNGILTYWGSLSDDKLNLAGVSIKSVRDPQPSVSGDFPGWGWNDVRVNLPDGLQGLTRDGVNRTLTNGLMAIFRKKLEG